MKKAYALTLLAGAVASFFGFVGQAGAVTVSEVVSALQNPQNGFIVTQAKSVRGAVVVTAIKNGYVVEIGYNSNGSIAVQKTNGEFVIGNRRTMQALSSPAREVREFSEPDTPAPAPVYTADASPSTPDEPSSTTTPSKGNGAGNHGEGKGNGGGDGSNRGGNGGGQGKGNGKS